MPLHRAGSALDDRNAPAGFARTTRLSGLSFESRDRLVRRLVDREDLVKLGHPEDLPEIGVEPAQLDMPPAGLDALLEVGQDAEGKRRECPDLAQVEHHPRVP